MSDWLDFIEKQTINDGALADNAKTALTQFGVIKVTGDDRLTFLQGQLTNDINKTSEGNSQLSAYCSPKGRILTSFRIIPIKDGLLMVLAKDRLDETLKRLRMFVLMSKVVLEDISDELFIVEYSGQNATDSLGLSLPDLPNETIEDNDIITVRIPGDCHRAWVIANSTTSRTLWQTSVANASSIEQWQLLDIRAGIPTIYQATSDAFVPQMVNLQLIEGVSFTKGCYTGQEVVARMQYLGKLKRRMYRAVIDGETPKAGTELFSASTDSGQGAGKVVNAAMNDEGKTEMLIVTPISAIEADDLHVGSPDGPKLTALNLPYAYAE
jgi:folate-binding protein YgfZ